MTGIKRLSSRQSRKVNTLVKKECCNCENGNCILLDDGDTCVCPQLISYSLLCKWFRIAVLPLDKLLYAELYQTEDRKKCTVSSVKTFLNMKNKNNAITAGKTVLLKKSFQISPRVMVSLLFYWELWDSF